MPLPKRPTVAATGAASPAVSRDARFANFQHDPKFRLPSKKHAKTKLDARFARVRTDPDFYTKATVDKYGRAISKDEGKKAIDRLYAAASEDEDHDDEPHAAARKRDQAVAKELARVQEQGFDPIRDGGLDSSSDESEDEDADDDIEDETELAGGDNAVPTGDISARLAAVNMDWDNMRAIDIMGVATSFVPPGGRILNVVIYPSEFGMERLQREEMEGPPRAIFASSSKSKDDMATVGDSAEPEASDDDEPSRAELGTEDTGAEFDSTALRNYQLDRLRYYYAVITCSSAHVAKSIYDNLDGREYLTSANFFDLRFVPDGTTFDQDPHDECDKLPDTYKPNEFSTDALTHSKVRLTWDADDTTRKEVQKRAFSRKEIDENELKAYLGSDSSSSEDDVDMAKADKASKLRAALGLDAPGKSAKPKQKPSAKRDRDFPKPDGEMEITFTGGLLNAESKGSVFENEIPIHETTMERYVRKEKERKARRKERAKARKEGRDPDAGAEAIPGVASKGDAEDPFDDPFFASDPEDMARAERAEKAESKKSKKAKKREEEEQEAEATAAERANLELLMAGEDDAELRHFDMKEIAKAEKAKRKGKKTTKSFAVVEDNFQINTTDPRFAKIYESHEFAIDPTNPKFKETQGMKALLEEGRKKRKQVRVDDEEAHESQYKKSKMAQGGTGADDVKKLAARIKAKSRQK
ncbi:pre-rRNA-processing protein esf1 [Pleosporales sp. CAS-2024a]